MYPSCGIGTAKSMLYVIIGYNGMLEGKKEVAP